MSSKKNKKILFVADHASNYIPSSLKNLGLKDNQLNSHIAYDVGVKELCINLSNLLNSNYIIGEYSRLIIDLNRDISDPTLIPEIVDRKIISKNLSLTFSLRMLFFLDLILLSLASLILFGFFIILRSFI